jgi:hypothetical protein
LRALKTSLLLKTAENLYKGIPVFFDKKLFILRLVFSADETSATCLANSRD